MFKKRRSEKKRRSAMERVKEAGEEEMEDDSEVVAVKVRRNKRKKPRRRVLLSFGGQEEEEEEEKEKKKKVVMNVEVALPGDTLEERAGQPVYDSASLKQLYQSSVQPSSESLAEGKTEILAKEEIALIKEERRRRRAPNPIGVQAVPDDDFMPLMVEDDRLPPRKEKAQNTSDDSNDEPYEEPDDELEEWELDRIRVGSVVPMNKPSLNQKAAAALKKQQRDRKAQQASVKYQFGEEFGEEESQTVGELLSGVYDSLVTNAARLQEKAANVNEKLKRLGEELAGVEEEKQQQKLAAEENALTVEYFDALEPYMFDLSACQAVKAPQIDSLRKELNTALRHHYSYRWKRRDALESAEWAYFMDREADNPMSQAVEKIRSRRRQLHEEAHCQDGYDLFYRGPVQLFASNAEDETVQLDEGFLDSQQELQEHLEEIFAEAKSSLDNVVPDFSQLALIKDRLERWKYDFPGAYQRCYCSDILPRLFSLFVQLECLWWDPFEIYQKNEDADGPNDDKTHMNRPIFLHAIQGKQVFVTMQWFEQLFNYGLSASGDTQENDPDLQLIPRLVGLVIGPIAHTFIAYVWDPFSLQSTQTAVNLLDELRDYRVRASDDWFQALEKCLANRFHIAAQSVRTIEVPSDIQNDATYFLLDLSRRLLRLHQSIILCSNVFEGTQLLAELKNKLHPFLQLLQSKLSSSSASTSSSTSSSMGSFTETQLENIAQNIKKLL